MDSMTTACIECSTLKSELNSQREIFFHNYDSLKNKIISTDLLIRKYKEREKQLNLNCKQLEDATILITKLQKELKSSGCQLKEALLNAEPLKKENEVFASNNKALSEKIATLETQLLAAEKTREQYEVIAAKYNEDTRTKDSIETLQNKEKALLSKLFKSKDEINTLKGTLKEAKSQYSKLLKRNKIIQNNLIKFGNLLARHKLLNKLQSKVLAKFCEVKENNDEAEDSDLESASFEIESQLLHEPTSAEVSIQTEALEEELHLTKKNVYIQTDSLSDINSNLLVDLLDNFIKIPRVMSPLPPSPKTFRSSIQKKSPLKKSKKPRTSSETCGCCKKVVDEQKFIEDLKNVSNNIQAANVNEMSTFGENVISVTDDVIIVIVDDENSTTENTVEIDDGIDHSYCAIQPRQGCEASQDRNGSRQIEDISNNLFGNGSFSKVAISDNKLNSFTIFKVPFIKRGCISSRFHDDDNFINDYGRISKVNFFRKGRLCPPNQSEEIVPTTCNLNTETEGELASVIGTSNTARKRKISSKTNSQTKEADQSKVKKHDREAALNNSFRSAYDEGLSTVNLTSGNLSPQIESVLIDAIGSQNVTKMLSPLKKTPPFKNDNGGIEKHSNNSEKRQLQSQTFLILSQKPSKAQSKIRNFKNPYRISPITRNKPKLKSSSICSNVSSKVLLNKTPSQKIVEECISDYTLPVPKKVRISHYLEKTSSNVASCINAKLKTNDETEKNQLMIDLFGEADTVIKTNTCNIKETVEASVTCLENVDNQKLMTDLFGEPDMVTMDIAAPSDSNDDTLTVGPSSHDADIVVDSCKQNTEATNEVVQKDVSINNAQLTSSVNVGPTVVSKSTVADEFFDDNADQPVWKSILMTNLFTKKQKSCNEKNTRKQAIANFIQLLSSVPSTNATVFWKDFVSRLEAEFTSSSLNTNQFVKEIAMWVQLQSIDMTEAAVTLITAAANNFESVLTQAEKNCLLLLNHLESTKYGETIKSQFILIFTQNALINDDVCSRVSLLRVLIAFYRNNNQYEMAKILCYDVIYCAPSLSGIALIFIFAIWSELFTGENAKRSCILKLICYVLKHEPFLIGLDVKLADIIKKYLPFEQNLDCQNLMCYLNTHMNAVDGFILEALKSFELLGKIKQWEWTKSFIIKTQLFSMFSRQGLKLLRSQRNYRDSLICNYLYLLGCLCKQAPIEDVETVGLVLRIATSLLKNKQEAFCIQETAALISVMLMTYDCSSVAYMIRYWLPRNQYKLSFSLRLFLMKQHIFWN